MFVVGVTMPELTPEERRQIYEEEKARVEGGRPSAGLRAFLSRRLMISALCTVLAVGGLGGFAYQEYRLRSLKQKLAEAIGKDLGLTETILKVESESSKITFAEFFELCNKSVENRTNLIVELRGLYPEMDYRLKTRLVDYLSAENEFVRAKRDFYRRSMEQSSATDSYIEQMKDSPSSSYGWDFYRDRLRQTKIKVIEAAREAEKSADEFLKVYEKMSKEESLVAKEAQDAGLRFEPIFLKHAKANQKRAEETKQGAQQLAKMF